MPPTQSLRLLGTGLLFLFIAACAGPPTISTEDQRQQLVRQAAPLEQQGNHRGAAELWLNAARQTPERRQEFELAAAESLFRGGDTTGATEIVNRLLKEQLPGGLFIDVRLLTARVGNKTQQYSVALDALRDLPEPVPAKQRRAITEQRIAALRGLNDQPTLVNALADYSRYLVQPEQIRENADQLWQAIKALSDPQLRALSAQSTSISLSGWLELAAISRRYSLNPAALQGALVEWQTRFPQHMGNFGYLDEVTQLASQPARHPENITVLLPLSGQLAGPGRAIREGIVAAWFELDSSQKKPRLEFVDTATNDALSAYLYAMEGGTKAIIGPLTKANLTKIAVSGELPIPVMGLNRLPQGISAQSNLFQFGLAPEDDARTVAERGLSESMQRALVLVPDSDWGKRVAGAFSKAFEQGGGQTLAVEGFGEKMTDFATPLKALLGLTESDQRKRDLRAITGAAMEFEPRRRQDTDFVFLAANPRQARLIRPLLQFHRASDIPLYASSHVYTGNVDAQADKDMDGLEFCDIPWIVGNGRFAAQRTRMERQWPGQAGHARLQALGYDAFNTLPMLGRLRSASGTTIDGATGAIFTDENGVVHRTPTWAKFDQGTARPLEQQAVLTPVDE